MQGVCLKEKPVGTVWFSTQHTHAVDGRVFKIDTEDKGISFPVGERSTLKG
jgi:nicotinamide mononucleotide (NMN) deamidase PncC